MPDEDDRFADIVKQEFNEHWDPSSQPEPPKPDFQLNLYDDDESYREVSELAWLTNSRTRWGVGLIGLGVAIAVLKLVLSGSPAWIGWASIVSFGAGVGLCLWQATHTPPPDDEGAV